MGKKIVRQITPRGKKYLRKKINGSYTSDKVHDDSIIMFPDGTIRGEKNDLSGHIIIGSWKDVEVKIKK